MADIISHIKNALLPIQGQLRKRLVKPVMPADDALKKIFTEYNDQRFYGPQKFFCYAPFGSLFISYNGRVSPCYACKAEGSLTNATLSDIWNGPTFNALREQFSKGDIPEACAFCKNHLKSGNYGSILANKYDHYLMSDKGFPVIAELELSNNCHLECIMCSGNLSSAIRSNREQLPPLVHHLPIDFSGQFLPFLRQLKSLELTGGDPFLIDIYYDILKAAEKFNPKLNILITTNANTYNDKAQALLKKNLRLSFNVSIDSLDETTYAGIRCNGSLSKALRNISLFSEYTKKHGTTLGFLVCPLRQNRKELPAFVPFANKYNATLSYHVVFKPAQHALWSLPAQELEDMATYLASFKFEGNGFTQNINVRSYNSLVTLVKSWHQKALVRESRKKETERSIEIEIEKSKEKLRKMVDDAAFFKTLNTLINQLPINEYPEMVYMALSQKSQQELLFGFQHFTKEDMLKKFTLYHQEMYASYFYHLHLSDNDKYSDNIL